MGMRRVLVQGAVVVVLGAMALATDNKPASAAVAETDCIGGCCYCDVGNPDCSDPIIQGDCEAYCGTPVVVSCDMYNFCINDEYIGTLVQCGSE